MKLGFDKSEVLVRTGNGLNIATAEPFRFTRKDGVAVEVPVGTTSDGASTPRIVWPTLPPFGLYWLAAVLHDYLYRDSDYPKDFCDETLLEAMEWLGVPLVERDTVYEGVHLFGWHAFVEDRAGRERGGHRTGDH